MSMVKTCNTYVCTYIYIHTYIHTYIQTTSKISLRKSKAAIVAAECTSADWHAQSRTERKGELTFSQATVLLLFRLSFFIMV